MAVQAAAPRSRWRSFLGGAPQRIPSKGNFHLLAACAEANELATRLEMIVALFLALTAVQFVLSDSLPTSSYVVPTQQASGPDGGGGSRPSMSLRAVPKRMVACWHAAGRAGRPGCQFGAYPALPSAPCQPHQPTQPSAPTHPSLRPQLVLATYIFLFLVAVESIVVYHIVERHAKKQQAQVGGRAGQGGAERGPSNTSCGRGCTFGAGAP